MRSFAFSSFRSVGAALAGETRIRSIAASASTGSVSHVPHEISHSLGPREPYATRNSSNACKNFCASAVSDVCNRSRTSPKPSSNALFSSADPAICLPRSHIAIDGAADSTSPRPAINVSAAPGLPIASHT